AIVAPKSVDGFALAPNRPSWESTGEDGDGSKPPTASPYQTWPTSVYTNGAPTKKPKPMLSYCGAPTANRPSPSEVRTVPKPSPVPSGAVTAPTTDCTCLALDQRSCATASPVCS